MSPAALSGRPIHFIAPWNLSPHSAALPVRPGAGTVILVESRAKGRALPWHRQKLVLVLSAMRHFAAELRAAGHDVELVNASGYLQGIRESVARHGASGVIAVEPCDHGLDRAFREAGASGELGAPLTLLPDGGRGGHFLLTRSEFAAWAGDRPHLRMDEFYRFMRRRGGWLMDARGRPLGGRWSFDAENRKPARGMAPPPFRGTLPDMITREEMARVAAWSGPCWGAVDGFDWPVTRHDALLLLDDFFATRAPHFGDYEDAMLAESRVLWHTRLSPALNLGLLHPEDFIDRVLTAHATGIMPLAAAEGLLRQVVGWREFIRGVYWRTMPGLRAANALGAEAPLPDFYWEPGRTNMACMRKAVAAVHDHGWTHHIERLMVLGNFALLAGVRPVELSHWFWAGFTDAFEWVELPNVHGMALFADDTFTTKPYVASGAYIHRMSDYCKDCRYDVKLRTGPDACPFNALFWDFLARHRERFGAHPRLGALYRTWDRWPESERRAVVDTARANRASLRPTSRAWTYEDDAG